MPHADISSSPDKRLHGTKTKNGAWVRMGIREQRPAQLRKMGRAAYFRRTAALNVRFICPE